MDVATDDPDFQALLDDFDVMRDSWPANWRNGLGTLVSTLRREGYDFLAAGTERFALSSIRPDEYSPYVFGLNLCVEGGMDWPIKPLSYRRGLIWRAVSPGLDAPALQRLDHPTP